MPSRPRTPIRRGGRGRHRPKLERICSLRYRRVVAHDGTVRAGATILQLAARAGHRSQAGRRVELQLRLDGRLVVWDGERVLLTTPAPSDPVQLRALAAARVEPGTPAPNLGSTAAPSASHPWRRIAVGSKLYQQRLSELRSR